MLYFCVHRKRKNSCVCLKNYEKVNLARQISSHDYEENLQASISLEMN